MHTKLSIGYIYEQSGLIHTGHQYIIQVGDDIKYERNAEWKKNNYLVLSGLKVHLKC